MHAPGRSNVDENEARRPFDGIRDQFARAIAARKCHPCGCLHDTVAALEASELGRGELAPDLAAARAVFGEKKYDCLGCAVCYPAIAASLFAEASPGGLEVCPTGTDERQGWPPLPGDYRLLRYRAPVAVCTLNSDGLAAHLARIAPEGLAIVGTLRTENLGIERLIRNVLANPHIRRLVLCGEDTRQAVGHLPGQSLESLFANGLDDSGRIRCARGKRPVLKNVTRAQVDAFLSQVKLVPLVGEVDQDAVSARVRRAAEDAPGVFERAADQVHVKTISACEPAQLIADPAGYCVVYPDRVRGQLLVEHYTNAGVLDCVVEAATPAAVYAGLIERGLVSRLDHAAYLGRELARAEESLRTGASYVQDRAPGELVVPEPGPAACACSSACEVDEEPP